MRIASTAHNWDHLPMMPQWTLCVDAAWQCCDCALAIFVKSERMKWKAHACRTLVGIDCVQSVALEMGIELAQVEDNKWHEREGNENAQRNDAPTLRSHWAQIGNRAKREVLLRHQSKVERVLNDGWNIEHPQSTCACVRETHKYFSRRWTARLYRVLSVQKIDISMN